MTDEKKNAPPATIGDGGDPQEERGVDIAVLPEPDNTKADIAIGPQRHDSEAPLMYYCKGRFLHPAKGGWTEVNKDLLKSMLIESGFRKKPEQGESISQVDRIINKVIIQHTIDATITRLAGYRSGVHTFVGKRVLVKGEVEVIAGVKGDWPVLRMLIEGMFNETERFRLYGWLKTALWSARNYKNTQGQILCFAGDPKTFKSYLQHKIALIFDGCGKPTKWMTGQSAFNGDLAANIIQSIDDEAKPATQGARRKLDALYKQLAVSPSLDVHAKGQDAFSAELLWRTVVTCNLRAEDLTILPSVDESMSDKVVILNPKKPTALPMPLETAEERRLFDATVIAELPGFIWWLEQGYEIPPDLTCERFNIQSYINPMVRDLVIGTGAESDLLELIDGIERPEGWRDMTPSEILTSLQINNDLIYGIARTARALGAQLSKLKHQHPDRFLFRKSNGVRLWTIKAKEGH